MCSSFRTCLILKRKRWNYSGVGVAWPRNPICQHNFWSNLFFFYLVLPSFAGFYRVSSHQKSFSTFCFLTFHLFSSLSIPWPSFTEFCQIGLFLKQFSAVFFRDLMNFLVFDSKFLSYLDLPSFLRFFHIPKVDF